MVLGRLRLRHGRNSWSASHLAYQETLLEALVERKRMLPCAAAQQRSNAGRAYSDYSGGRDADGTTDSGGTAGTSSGRLLDSVDSASSSAADAAAAAEAAAEAEAAEAEAADLLRIQQLIHCVEVRRTAQAKG